MAYRDVKDSSVDRLPDGMFVRELVDRSLNNANIELSDNERRSVHAYKLRIVVTPTK